MKKFLSFLILMAGLGGGGFWYLRVHAAHSGPVRFRTVKLERGELVEGVNASGTLEPFLLVTVGSQISGVIEKLFKDWNDKCVEGEVIALVDSRKYVAQVDLDIAALEKARADVVWKQALLDQAVNDLKRNTVLWQKKLIADSDLDGFKANEGSYRGQLADAIAVISQSQAQLDQDTINLKYCTIYSPVKGSVVSRQVDVGQTVAASLQAPTLFIIGSDGKYVNGKYVDGKKVPGLSSDSGMGRLQVQASVPEADVGRIKVGQHVPFTVDAFPDHIFEGWVSQIRLQSTSVNNVVTYTVMIDLDNPPDAAHKDGMLLPGMTANVTFEIAKSDKDSLHVMTTALRFEPALEYLEPEAREKMAARAKRGAGGGGGPRQGPSDGSVPDGGAPASRPEGKRRGEKLRGRVYIKNAQGLLHPVPVRLGVTDGAQVEVTPIDESTTLEPGTEVVIGVQQEEEENTTNPFAPKNPFGAGGRR